MHKLAWKYGVEREVMLKWIQHKNAVEWIEQQYDFYDLQQSCVDYQSRKGLLVKPSRLPQHWSRNMNWTEIGWIVSKLLNSRESKHTTGAFGRVNDFR